jgi:photosystem II stability/assembly factor-like uncharacterized protein
MKISAPRQRSLSLFSLLGFVLLFQSSIFPEKLFAQAPSKDNGLPMRWRMIGPHRGGRTVGAVGVPSQPHVFYIGVNNGGVWKTEDFGRTWVPIFDEMPTGSIGDVAVSESNPNVVWVASGEGIQRPDLSVGDGMYKSTDAGKTWTHMGLRDGQQIGGVVIDPKNENRVFVAVMGHPYGPNPERGVYRTLDGGKTWEKVLYKDENTGAAQVLLDPQNPNIVYADLWAGRQGPWENGQWNGPESGLFKSTDGGNTWTKLTQGLPTVKEGLGRIGLGIAPSQPNRLYATVEASGSKGGIYRSDNGGSSWYLLSNDNRYWGRASDFAEIKVDPKNPDWVYSANVVTWKSTDGGKSWSGFRGAPGGDDYHRIWINPNDPEIILLASDQGAIITVNGGKTFSSWYNQATAQFYHVNTDNAFPYNVYGGQQESGSVGIASRGNDGQITFREWHPVGVEEYGYVAPDPKNANIIYGGKITRFDKRTGQTQNIAPHALRFGPYRFLRTAPVIFSPADSTTLYFAGNKIFATRNGGQSWDTISPDLSRETWEVPASVGIYNNPQLLTMPRRGVVYTLAPGVKNNKILWAGTDDGLIHVTRDGGKTWTNVTPQGLPAWSKISLIEAGHFDDQTAYAAVNRIRCDDQTAYVYKTHDGGKSWTLVNNGLPAYPVNAVREDPVQKGLLFAGTENAVWYSLDDGAHWQSLRINMPATSIRDLVIKNEDIVVGTHGRSFWILDNITALRQMTRLSASQNNLKLVNPPVAYRIRWNMNTDTPLPQEEPAGQNPPDGAMIDYFLQKPAQNIVLDIKDAKGNLLRRYTNSDQPYTIPPVNIPPYWIRPQQILSGAAGAHRFLWDLRITPLPAPIAYPIAAVYGQTAPDQNTPWVMPGKYTVVITADGETQTTVLEVKMDPRVRSSTKDWQAQWDLSLRCYNMLQSFRAVAGKTSGATQKEIIGLNLDLSRLTAQVNGLLDILQDSDEKPTQQVVLGVATCEKKFGELQAQAKKIPALQ